MKNTLRNLSGPTLESLPISLSTQTNIDNIFSYDTFPVAVNYYVLRPKAKNNS